MPDVDGDSRSQAVLVRRENSSWFSTSSTARRGSSNTEAVEKAQRVGVLGGVCALAGAAGRAPRTGSVFGGSDQGTFPPPWPGLGMNPPGPALRAETYTDPTVLPLPEEGVEATAEPEIPSAEILRRVLAGARELDVSRVKLAKITAPTGSRGLPPAKAWQEWFTIRLRTWANVISPEFETELVKKVLCQPADLSRHGAA